jgi:hypothetical protein
MAFHKELEEKKTSREWLGMALRARHGIEGST